jgi:hypothetical protein
LVEDPDDLRVALDFFVDARPVFLVDAAFRA